MGEETIEETKKEKEETKEAKEAPEKPLDKMTVKELREVAKEIPGITGITAMKKDELLALVKDHRDIKDEGPAKKKKKSAAKSVLSVKQLKDKVSLLRVEKETARQAKDGKKIDILRRRINRLKKQTRKGAQG